MITFNEAQIMAWLTPIVWPFIRTIAMLAVLPLFNKRNIPNSLKIMLAIFVALCVQSNHPNMPVVPLGTGMSFILIVQQIVIGLTIGFAVRVIFTCAEYAGELIGMKMGLNFAGFFDPITANNSTSLTSLFSLLIAWFFISINGHLIMFQAIDQSFIKFPVGTTPFEFLNYVKPWLWGVEIFKYGLLISLPLLSILLFVNLIMGIISKVAPTVQIFSVGLPFGLIIGLLSLWYLIPRLEQPFNLMIEKVLLTLT